MPEGRQNGELADEGSTFRLITTYWILPAERLIALAIALCDSNGVIDIVDLEIVVCNIAYMAETATAVKQCLESSLNSRPDLDAGSVTCILHRNIVDVQIFDDIGLQAKSVPMPGRRVRLSTIPLPYTGPENQHLYRENQCSQDFGRRHWCYLV